MPVALAQQAGGLLSVPQQVFQLKEQVVIIQHAHFPAIGRIGLAQGRELLGIGQQMKGLALQDVFQGLFLVACLAQQTHHGLRLGKGTISLAHAQFVPAGLDGCGNVCPVHDREGAVPQPGRTKTPQDAVGKGMKGAALHLGQRLTGQQPRPVQHFLRGLARKGQQQHGFRRNAVFRQPGQTVGDGPGLAAAGTGHHKYRAVSAGHGRILGLIERFGIINHANRLA